jgi:hypothetical protein
MRKLVSELIAGVWRQSGVERAAALQRPLAVVRNWFIGDSRMTVPVLWDRACRLIVSSESSEIPHIREVAR